MSSLWWKGDFEVRADLRWGETRPDWHQPEVAATEDEQKDKRHWPQVRPAPIMLSSFIEDRGGGGVGETHIYRNDQLASFLLFSSSSNISIIGKISAAVLSVPTCAAPHIVALFASALIGTDRFLLWNTVTRQRLEPTCLKCW